jgi:hypothetical protein
MPRGHWRWYAGLLPAVAQHLPVERHAAIGVVGVERRDDLLPALDPNPLAGLQAAYDRLCPAPEDARR